LSPLGAPIGSDSRRNLAAPIRVKTSIARELGGHLLLAIETFAGG
jgi:hypothetical protein